MCCLSRTFFCFLVSFCPCFARSFSTAFTAASAFCRESFAFANCFGVGILLITVAAAWTNGPSTPVPPLPTVRAISIAFAFAFCSFGDFTTFFAVAFTADVPTVSATFPTAAAFWLDDARGFVTTSIAWVVAELGVRAVTLVRLLDV